MDSSLIPDSLFNAHLNSITLCLISAVFPAKDWCRNSLVLKKSVGSALKIYCLDRQGTCSEIYYSNTFCVINVELNGPQDKRLTFSLGLFRDCPTSQ